MATLEASIRGFSCYPRSFYFEDLAGFTAKLRTAMRSQMGRVEFGSPYAPDRIVFQFSPAWEYVAISCDIGRAEGSNGRLTFSFEVNHTYIGAFLDSLEQIKHDVHR
jgi:hypothetical protein